MAKGPANLRDRELLAILLRTGRQGQSALELADAILTKYPKKKLLNITYSDLIATKGINTAKATTILAALEFTKRITKSFKDTRPFILSPSDTLHYLRPLCRRKQEHFVCLYLNARCQLIHTQTISIGTLDKSLVHPREVLEPALKHFASTIILAHNHPSGHAQPSDQDQELTQHLISAAQLLDIDIADHLIITETSYYSFQEQGLL